jgi:hypothetical protein
MHVGIIELLTDTRTSGWVERAYHHFLTRQYVSIVPQAIAVWCREMGHTVTYTSYYGQADAHTLLPKDLDVLFVCNTTRAAGIAYALAKIYRKRGTRLVIGGPHAKSYPADCLRYYDLVVKECDRQLIEDILGDQFDYPSVVTSGKPLTDIPSVEERMPEIRKSIFGTNGRPSFTSMVALLSSVGCPYTCNFCTDWNNKYETLSTDRLEADLRYISEHYPQVLVAYHDPNFAVRFDETMAIMERLPMERRNRYVMESSLAIMKASRLTRLKDTRCVFVAPGVESWADYSNKAGTGHKHGREKLTQVVEHFDALRQYVPGLQANFLFGLDGDSGAEPVELTKEFIRRSPEVWPTINIPTPLGGTPLFDDILREGRMLGAMPFTLYFTPYYSVTRPKHYSPIEFYDHMADIYSTIGSLDMVRRRLTSRTHPYLRFLNAVRSLACRSEIGEFKTVRKMLATDKQFLAFHEGRSPVLPEFYQQRFEQRMGPYAEMFPRGERQPVLDAIPELHGRTSYTPSRSVTH